MLQPVYVFIIFVLKKSVIDVIMGRDIKKKKRPIRSANPKKTNLTRKSIFNTNKQNGYEEENISNPAFSITMGKETDSSVIPMSAKAYEEIPLRIPSPQNNFQEVHN